MVKIIIDIDMPKSCKDCPFQDEAHYCQFVPGVPAWQAEIVKYTDRRSEHCPLVED